MRRGNWRAAGRTRFSCLADRVQDPAPAGSWRSIRGLPRWFAAKARKPSPSGCAHSFSGEPLARFLAGHRSVVAISCFVDMLPAVIDATRQLAGRRPDTLFVLGGPGPTASARRILEEYPWIAAVVRGEGEETIAEWGRNVRGGGGARVAGMISRRGNELIAGASRARNRALDELPLPSYHLIDWARYSTARIITTRGCSYRCSFCDVTALWGNRSVYQIGRASCRERV